MTKALHIAKVNLLDIFRDLKSNAFIFILPAMFILIFGFLFNQSFENQQFEVATIDVDAVENSQYMGLISGIESALEDEENAVIIFNVFPNEEEAKESVRSRGSDVALLPGENSSFTIIINEANQASSITASILVDFLNPMPEGLISYDSVIGRNDVSGFQLQAAGLIIYGILTMIPQVAGSLAKLNDQKYLFRYSSSKAKAFDIIGGFTISSFIICIIQTILLFYVASWFGLKLDIYTLQSLIFVIPVILFAIGTGLLIGAFAPKGETGINVGSILSIILGFLSGGFIVGIDRIGIEIGSVFVAITDFVPTFYASAGMTQLLIFNANLTEVLLELAVISVFAVLLFIAGVVAYGIRQL